jgi:hypothetical protein
MHSGEILDPEPSLPCIQPIAGLPTNDLLRDKLVVSIKQLAVSCQRELSARLTHDLHPWYRKLV